MRVLIVDDEPGICQRLQQELRKEGCEVDYTTSAIGVLERLKNAEQEGRDYTLLLVDLRMPKVDGLSLLKEIRVARLDLDVVIITGYGDEDKAIESIRLGAMDYLRKPISLEALHTVVFRVQQKRAAEEKRALEYSVLVVDDEKELCERIKRELDKEGYRIAVAYDGVEGLDYFSRNRVDVAIVDIKMPRMSGLEMLKKCREITDDFVSIIITGHGDHEKAIHALQLGVFNYLRKPVSLEELVTSVGKGIELLHLRRGLAARGRELEIETALKEQYAQNLERMVEERTKEIKKFSDAIEASTESIVISDLEAKITDVNEATLRMYGTGNREDLVGKSSFDLIAPEDQQKAVAGMEEALEKGYVKDREGHVITKDGSRIPVEMGVAIMKGMDGEPIGFVGVTRDITERKQAEEALRESEEKHRVLIETTDTGYLILDAQGRVIDANKEYIRLTGYGALEEILGRSVVEWTAPHDLERNAAELKKCVEQGYVRNLEIGYVNRSEQITPIEINATVVGSGDSVRILLLCRDISERKRAEEVLRTSEAQLSNAMMIAKLGYWEYDVDDDLFIFNDHFYNIFRTNAKKVGGYKMSPERYAKQFVHPDDIPIVGNETRKAIETTDPNFNRQIEHRIIYADGEIGYISVRFFIVKDSHGRTVKTYGANQDITERKKMEDELKDSEIRYHNLFENSSEFIYTLDLKGNFTDVNKAALALTGYTKSELLKMNFKDYTPKRDHSKLFLTFSNIYKTGKPLQNLLIEAIMKDKSKKYFETSISLIKKGEQIIGFQGSSKDITERKLAEEERERLLAEIAAKNQELESFVYTISHDLRAPLVSMDGFYSLLKRESQDQLGEQGQHYLERIRANVAHMNTLVTELLELSRIGRVVGPEEEIDVGVLLREIEEGLVLKLEQEGVEFIVQQPLPAVRGDRGRIRQVFANLIENAVKFRSLERGLRIEVGCEEERGFYRFHVRDNGIGILPQYQEQIFEPFRQLDRGIEGVGMGLALVKRIVAYHRGRFWVESELGKGSTFYFTIPDRTNGDVRSAKYDRRLTRKRREPMKESK